jgi:hypothetical protein
VLAAEPTSTQRRVDLSEQGWQGLNSAGCNAGWGVLHGARRLCFCVGSLGEAPVRLESSGFRLQVGLKVTDAPSGLSGAIDG